MYCKKHKYDACIITNKYDISFVKALESIVSQNVQPEWIYIIDDHSKEDIEKSLKLKPSNISFVRNASTLGRGFCRNLAHSLCTNDLVFSLDSTNVVDSSYVANAIELIMKPNVVAVYGRILNHKTLDSPKYKWRNYFLFNANHNYGNKEIETNSLSTYATLTKRRKILEIGNFKKSLRHSEDHEISRRIVLHDYKIIGTPNLITYSTKEESIFSMYERYWRWNYGHQKKIKFNQLLKIIKFFLSKAFKSNHMKFKFRMGLYTIMCPLFGFFIHKYKLR